MDRLLYFAPSNSAFVRKDVEILSRHYNVVFSSYPWTKKWLLPLNLIRQFFFLLVETPRVKAIFVMFAGFWSFLPALFGKLFNKRVFIILGGTECVSFPSLDYGSLRKPLLRWFIRKSMKWCHMLLPVHESLVISDYTYVSDPDYEKQGYAYFLPEVDTPYHEIHNGFDPVRFNPGETKKEPRSFITVAVVDDMARYRLKGFDSVVFLAETFPDCTFTIVGMGDRFREQLPALPPNITVYPFLSPDDFTEHLRKSRFYLQLSLSEGFPNALCEAMLCGCIPIGSAVASIPFIIDDTGFVVQNSAKETLVAAVNKALALDPRQQDELGKKARERIEREFHISKREKAFLEVLGEG